MLRKQPTARGINSDGDMKPNSEKLDCENIPIFQTANYTVKKSFSSKILKQGTYEK